MVTFQSRSPGNCFNWTTEYDTDHPWGGLDNMDGINKTQCFRWCEMTVNCVGAAIRLASGSNSTGHCYVKENIQFYYLVPVANLVTWYCS
ncbi:unnamed protein product [Adineta ricciae]|uniref:Apple domain-containing protein n=1 Tax=Adineta ricciae TaxID=249248 RepID=A0A816C9G8_ADIRI|nr:unnamed protein product [Adineta ricciae]